MDIAFLLHPRYVTQSNSGISTSYNIVFPPLFDSKIIAAQYNVSNIGAFEEKKKDLMYTVFYRCTASLQDVYTT